MFGAGFGWVGSRSLRDDNQKGKGEGRGLKSAPWVSLGAVTAGLKPRPFKAAAATATACRSLRWVWGLRGG